jgi:alkylation response protein AidB-like acyl-CoA dehydrogenase
MDFDLNDDQKMLSRTVSDFGKKESTLERFRKQRDAEGLGWDPATWRKMGELGWLAVSFPDAVGGYDGSFVETALILEQFGKTLVPEPILPSLVLGGTALLLGGDAGQHVRFLTPMINGETTLALAYGEAGTRTDRTTPTCTATAKGAGFVLSGKKHFVLNGHGANHIVVSAMVDGELSLFVVDADAVKRTELRLMDGHRGAHIDLAGVEVGQDRRLVARPGHEVLEAALDRGAAATVAEGLGIAHAMLWMTVEYLKTREQFGVKIGSFQALQHRAVDMFVEVELLKSVNAEAAVMADQEGLPRQRAVSTGKLQLSRGGQFVARQAIQLHGGVGVTDEHDIGLYFKRMHALSTLCGDETFHVRRYSDQLTH